MRHVVRQALRLSVSIAAVAQASTALGQSQAPDPAGLAVTATEPSAHPVDGLADIIVTATKVTSTLQKTPETITTIDSATLERAGVTNVQALNKLVGGLQIETNGPASSIYIRGVGSRVTTPIADPAVAFSVDGVYYSRPLGTSQAFFDLSRVEVVKGPQGTLYGRNATGGAVNLVTNRPELDVRSVDGELEIGDYQEIRSELAVNLPVNDTVALRVAEQTVNHHGYLSDGYDDADSRAVRASLLFKPSDRFTLYVSGDYAHQGGQGAGVVPVGPGSNNNALTTRFVVPGDPRTGGSDPRITAFIQQAVPVTAIPFPGPGVYCLAAPIGPAVVGAPAIPLCANPLGIPGETNQGYIDDDYYGANVTAVGDVGIGELTAVGGYRGTKLNTLFYIDPNPQTETGKIDQFSGELRLASKPGDSRLKWLIGGFYLHEKQNTAATNLLGNSSVPNPFPSPGSPLPATACVAAAPIPGLCIANTLVLNSFSRSDPDIEDETYAGFGQATFAITDRFRAVGGIRYTHERKSEVGGMVSSAYTVPAGVVTSYPNEGAVSYNNVSYRAGLEFDIAPRSLLYVTNSTAFHAGGFNFGVEQGPNAFDYQPEKVRSYVIGSKNRFLDNRLQVNVELFWLDYDNYQQNVFGNVNDGSVACSTLGIEAACPLTIRTVNAATARSRGVETDIVYRPLANTTLNANILYSDATFLTFRLPNAQTGVPLDYDGARLPGSVPWTITGGINQAFPLANGARIIADVRTQFRTGAYLWFTNTPAVYQPAYTRTDLSLTYELPRARVSITGFVRNVENTAAIQQGGPVSNSTGAVDTNLIPPRTYGALLGFHF